MITEDTLSEWETLAEKATPGPWESRPGHEDSGLIHYDVEVKGRVDRVCSCWESDAGNLPRKANAAFIAASREAVPALCAEVRRLREALRGLAQRADDLGWPESDVALWKAREVLK